MENFVNNWRMALTLSAGATSLAVSLPDGLYRLTARDADASRFEIMLADVLGGTATLERGLEDTGNQEWPAGSLLYQSITAETLRALSTPQSAAYIDAATTLGEVFEFEFIAASGITVSIGFPEPVYSNMPLAGSPRAFTTSGLSHVRLLKVDNAAALIVTPVQLYT